MSERLTMTVSMEVTPSQALALKAMFEYWNTLSSVGSSREVGFYVDGDGNFHPRCTLTFSKALPDLTADLRQAAIIKDTHYSRVYDFDPIAWRINHPEQIQEKE